MDVRQAGSVCMKALRFGTPVSAAGIIQAVSGEGGLEPVSWFPAVPVCWASMAERESVHLRSGGGGVMCTCVCTCILENYTVRNLHSSPTLHGLGPPPPPPVILSLPGFGMLVGFSVRPSFLVHSH